MDKLRVIKEEHVREEVGEMDNEFTDDDYDDDDDEEEGIKALLSLRAQKFVIRFLKGFGSGLGVYSGIKIVTALMKNPFRERPVVSAKSVAKNVVWSTAFLATMVMVAKYGICLLRNLLGRPPPLPSWIPAASGFAAGLGVLFERVHRRRELSLFLIPHTLYALYLFGKENKIIRHIPHSSLFLFALSMVPIMHAYEREPESLNLLLHSALKFFVGKRQSTKERKKRRTTSGMSM
ncbi:hypothetical protein ACF0H5_007570 [Mactra antiquata]